MRTALVRLYETSGTSGRRSAAAGPRHGGGFTGEARDTETFFSYTDYVTPAPIYRYDPRTNTATPWRRPRIPAKTDAYVTEQVFYKSKDGTRVPMFITHRRDMQKDGNQPVLLYGYGGFNVSLTPPFSAPMLAWLEMGGVFAEANLRGGGEYGEAWHLAGTRSTEAERVRRLHRGRRVPDPREVHAARSASRSTAAATAACWSAPC